MTTIMVPAHVAAIAEMEATSAASAVTTGLRSTGTTMSDVADWMTAHGAPDDWTGDAAEAADHAMTGYARDTAAATAAFTRVAAACDRYVDRIVALTTVREGLVSRRTRLNQDIDDLHTRIAQSTADDVAALEAQSRALQGRADRLVDDITALWDDVEAAEDRLIEAFRAVDTTGEGADAADRDTTDISALRSELTALGGDPDAINQWWEGLTRAEQEALKISDPDLVGNTNGIPTGDRDEANRTSLRARPRPPHGQAGGRRGPHQEEQRLLDRAEAARDALNVPTVERSARRRQRRRVRGCRRRTSSSTSRAPSAVTARWRSATATRTRRTTRRSSSPASPTTAPASSGRA